MTLLTLSIVFSIHHAPLLLTFFFFNDTATTEIYTLSLHDALPISRRCGAGANRMVVLRAGSLALSPVRHRQLSLSRGQQRDRKSTRLNSSHGYISYAVFCLKKKKKTTDCIHA